MIRIQTASDNTSFHTIHTKGVGQLRPLDLPISLT